MSKEVWLRAYEKVYNEHSESKSEAEMAELANEEAAHMEALLIDEAMMRYKYEA